MTSDDETAVLERLANLHPVDRNRAGQAVADARHALTAAVERLQGAGESLPADVEEMTLDELDELVGARRQVADNLDGTADRAAMALDDLRSAGDE